ncbi:hypothetical protein V5799_011898, partial [Amblyomma americanum]
MSTDETESHSTDSSMDQLPGTKSATGAAKGAGDAADSNAAMRRLEMELELRKTTLLIERERNRQLELQTDSPQGSQAGGRQTREEILAYFAERLKSLLTPIPTDPEVPVWLEGVEGIFRSYKVPDEVKSHLLLLLVSARIPHLFSKLSTEELDSYDRVKQTIRSELRLSPGDYRRQFRSALPGRNETWQHLASRIESYHAFYMSARGIKTLEDLVLLNVADQMKQALSTEAYKYVKREEGDSWVKPHEIAKLVEAFEDCEGKGSGKKQILAAKSSFAAHQPASFQKSVPASREKPHASRPSACFICNGPHFARSCPKNQRNGNTQKKSENRVAEGKYIAADSYGDVGIDTPGQRATVDIQSSSEPMNTEGLVSLEYVDFRCGEVVLRALIDTGAEITVIKEGAIPSNLMEE